MDSILSSRMYSTGNSPCLTADDYVALWTRLGVLVEGLAGVVYSTETVVDEKTGAVRVNAGDGEALRAALPMENGFLTGGVAVDDDLVVYAGELGAWRNGAEISDAYVSISENLIRRHGFSGILDLLRLHIESAAESGAFYGLVDYSKAVETCDGGTYGSVIHLDAPLRSIVEQSIWLQQGVRQKRVRGVYWGNYLSNELLEKLGGNLAEEYREQAQNLNGDPTGLVWEFPGGTFVSISLDPTVGSPFGEDMIDIETLENLNWLVERFTEARLL